VQPLAFWINDVLMTVFFFVVGLEIRRELHDGELAERRRAALPIAAALGGMLAPAAIYALINHGHAGARGWGIPMATDIAFAVGVLTLLGKRVAPPLRTLLLALAVIDDIGAIVVIAVFYRHGGALDGIALTTGGLAFALTLRAAGLRSPVIYAAPSVVMWIGLWTAGIHPTLAGVLLGLITPVQRWQGREATSPAVRLQRALHPWVAYAVMPLFALANAGVALAGASLAGDGLVVFLGVVLGLAVGKPLGIFAASTASTALGVAARGPELSQRGVALVGVVGGIGFTMSLFIAQLAFPSGPLLATAKLAIIVGSATASVLGIAVALATLRSPRAA
jgi:NhaA family Na+:H+ antiporter